MPCMYVLLRRGSGRDTLSYGMADKDTHPHHYLPHSSSSPTPASRYRHQQHNLRQQQPQKAHQQPQKAHHQHQQKQQHQRHSSSSSVGGSSSSNALAAAPASTSASVPATKARSFRDESLVSPKKKKLKLILKLRKPLQDSPPALPPPQGVRSKGLGANGTGSAGLGSSAAGSSASGAPERGLGALSPSPTQPRTLQTRSAGAGNGLAGPIGGSGAAATGGAPVELHRKGAAATSASASESTEAAEDEGLPHYSKKRKLRDVPDLKNEEEKTPGMAAPADDTSKRRLKDKEAGSNGVSAPGQLHGSNPQQKMLEELLDRFQKKDTYGVFAEPVDPAEIPDYHDIIKEPMDFSTVRKKLLKGLYTSLELFEKDVMLICSNAMRYNAPRTIYYKQAKSIKDTARKAFDAQKGRLNAHRKGGGKQNSTMKKSKRSATTKRSGEVPSSDYPSGAALATTDGKRTSTIDRVADLSHKSNSPFQSSANDLDIPEGSLGRSMSLKDGRRVLTVDENRRNTYRPPGFLDDDAPTQLVPQFGYQCGGAYAESLALFGANFNRSAWEFVARKIRKVLAPNVPFGPGWVGEQDASVAGFTTDSSTLAEPSKENVREEAKDTQSGETGTQFSGTASMANGSGVFSGMFSASTLSTVGIPVPLASRPSLASSACTPCGPSTGGSTSAAGTSSGFFPVPDNFIRTQTQNTSVAAPAQNFGKHWQNPVSSGSSMVTSQLGNVEANPQQFRNMEANSQRVRNVEANFRQFRNVEANPQQFRSVDASPQEHRNVESNAQQFRGADASPQQLKKGDANGQQLRNVEASSQHFKNVEQQIRHVEGSSQLFRNLEANSQQLRNVDAQSRKSEMNAQQVRNMDANSQNSQHFRNLEVCSQQTRSNVDATSQQLRKLESSQQLRSLDANSQQLRNVEASSQQLRSGRDANSQQVSSRDANSQQLRNSRDANSQQVSSRDANSQQLRNGIDANPQQLRNTIDVNTQQQQQQLRSSMDANSQQLRSSMDANSQQLRSSMDANSQQLRSSMDANSQQLRSSIGANSQQLRSSMDANPQQLRTTMDANSQQLRKLDQLRNVEPNQFRTVDGNSGVRFQLQKDHQGNVSSVENQETNKYPGPKFAGNVNNGSIAFPGPDSARGVWSLQRVLGQESAARDSVQRAYGQEQVTNRSGAEAGPLNFTAIPSMFPNLPAYNRVGVDRDAAMVQGRDLFQMPGLNGQSLMAKMPAQVQPSRPETQQHRFISDLNSRSEVSNGDFFRSHGQSSSSLAGLQPGDYQKEQQMQQAQMGVYNAISQSLLQPWKSVPSQRLVQQAPSSLRPLPPDLNVRLQSPKSPQQQSQQQQQHQQPDLALQL